MTILQALRGHPTISIATSAIQSQAETELRRKLTPKEVDYMFCNFSPKALIEDIQKVTFTRCYCILIKVFSFSMVLVTSTSIHFWAKEQNSYVKLPQNQHQEMETALFMVNLLKLTKTKRKCLSGISDGCLNNDALKHNKGEQLNETWTTLLKDLKFYEDIDDHTNYLREKMGFGSIWIPVW